MTETEDDRNFFRSLVRSIARDGGNFARRKRELAMYRAHHIRDYGVDEKDVDSVIEGVLCDFPYKIRKALTIKKHRAEDLFPGRNLLSLEDLLRFETVRRKSEQG